MQRDYGAGFLKTAILPEGNAARSGPTPKYPRVRNLFS